MKARKLLAATPLVIGALVLSACGGSGDNPGNESTPTQAPISAQDINAQPRDSLAQGGELRQAVSDFGNDWNPLSVNGNNADLTSARAPLLPSYFDFDAKGIPTPNPNFLESAEASGDKATVVKLKLNPTAVWGDGSPVDGDDLIATWTACNGENKKFRCASTQGFDSIASIKNGTDKFDVTVTFKTVYPDWSQALTGPLKAESVKDPATFNTGWTDLKNDWLSGPFKVEKFDKTQKVLTEVPNDKWWGDKPLLDQLSFRAIAVDATASAYVNNELDTFDIGPDPDAFQRSQTVADGTIRKAAGPNFRHFTFNTKAGLLADLKVRQAVVMGLNRTQIGESDLAGIDWPVQPLNNHVFVANQEGYADSAKATGIDYDPAKAKSTLEGDGWAMGDDGFYAKDGKTLEIGFAQLAGVPVSENEGKQAQDQLKDVGIKLNLTTVPIEKFQDGTLLSDHEFDIVAFSWIGTPYPFSSIKQIYGTGSESNYAQLSLPEVDDLVKQIDVETDTAKRIELANQADELIWENVHTLPLYQRPELIAAKKTLANFGAVGLSSLRYEDIGYQK